MMVQNRLTNMKLYMVRQILWLLMAILEILTTVWLTGRSAVKAQYLEECCTFSYSILMRTVLTVLLRYYFIGCCFI